MQPSAAQDKDGLPVTTGRGGFKNSNPKHPLQERKCLLFLTQTFFFFFLVSIYYMSLEFSLLQSC